MPCAKVTPSHEEYSISLKQIMFVKFKMAF